MSKYKKLRGEEEREEKQILRSAKGMRNKQSEHG